MLLWNVRDFIGHCIILSSIIDALKTIRLLKKTEWFFYKAKKPNGYFQNPYEYGNEYDDEYDNEYDNGNGKNNATLWRCFSFRLSRSPAPRKENK